MKLVELLGIKAGEYGDLEITGVTCDSRKVTVGSAFVCINGVTVDGHKFAKSAEENGAAVIISEVATGVKNEIIVKNSRIVFADMCKKWFGNPADSLKIIGVTGTNGKTSVCFMLKSILEQCGEKVGLIGTVYNMIDKEIIPSKNTTPSAYELQSMFALMKKAGCSYCVMEVSSHALDQNRVYGIDFEMALFTNLTQDHLDYHLTMENYLAAKKKLFTMCKKAVINIDDEYANELMAGLTCDVVTYSTKSDQADYTAKNIKIKSDGVSFEFVGYHLIGRVKTAIGGQFTPYNAMCAGTCALQLGYSLEDVINTFATMTGVKGRAEVVPTNRDFTVIIDYAHTPDGLENIIKTFKDCEKNRLTVLFGCGGDRDKSKRPKMGRIAVSLADNVIITSDNPRTEDPQQIINEILEGVKGYKTPYEVIENRVEAIKFAIKNAQKGDIIILAGKGHETYQVLKEGTIHLDEREVVAEALSEVN